MASPTEPPLTRKARAELTRQRILDAAVEKFSHMTYEDVSIAELARSANVAHGLLFFHFDNKRNLYLEAMREVARQLTDVHRVLDPDTDSPPYERIRGMFVGHLEYMSQRPDLAQSIIAGGLGADVESREIFEVDRWRISCWWLELVGLNPANSAIRLMVSALTSTTDAATLHWIRGGCKFPIGDIADVLMNMLVAALESAQILDPSLDPTDALALLRPDRN